MLKCKNTQLQKYKNINFLKCFFSPTPLFQVRPSGCDNCSNDNTKDDDGLEYIWYLLILLHSYKVVMVMLPYLDDVDWIDFYWFEFFNIYWFERKLESGFRAEPQRVEVWNSLASFYVCDLYFGGENLILFFCALFFNIFWSLVMVFYTGLHLVQLWIQSQRLKVSKRDDDVIL